MADIKEQIQEKRWLNGKEACKFVGMSYNTFKSIRNAGKVRYHQWQKTVLYDRFELIEDINSL